MEITTRNAVAPRNVKCGATLSMLMILKFRLAGQCEALQMSGNCQDWSLIWSAHRIFRMIVGIGGVIEYGGHERKGAYSMVGHNMAGLWICS